MIAKRINILMAVILMCEVAESQVGINPSNDPAAPSAGVDVKFTDRGFLQPRLKAEEISAISNPAVGLMVFNLSSGKPVYYDGVMWRNYDGTANWAACGDPLEIVHVAGVVAPVNKTVSYGTMSGVPGEPDKCWITSNLGSDHEATAYNDATEPSAGWYWQFNKIQGYKYDGTTRTPSTTWITPIDEDANWMMANDPCNSELGGGWRIPTATEWANVEAGSGDWNEYTDPFASLLKLHSAGRLNYNDGVVNYRGSSGMYWGVTQGSNTAGTVLRFNSTTCYIDNGYTKTFGCPLRCINCTAPGPDAPVEGTHVPSKTQIVWNWHPVPGADGYKWNTVNDYYSAEDMDTDTSKTETGLESGTSYSRYVWAYTGCPSEPVVINGSTLVFICGSSDITIEHLAGSVAPVNKTVSYGTVMNIPGEISKCWITSNLGASHQAMDVSDTTEASAGWYWQFNRKQGYKYTMTRTPGTWITDISENSDWTSSADPCLTELGSPWRIPTASEWTNVDNAGSWTYYVEPWLSDLKMHMAGFLYTDGTLFSDSRGIYARYWSGSQGGTSYVGQAMIYDVWYEPYVETNNQKENGFSIRCISEQ